MQRKGIHVKQVAIGDSVVLGSKATARRWTTTESPRKAIEIAQQWKREGFEVVVFDLGHKYVNLTN
jgi:hypothetical protein